MSTPSSSCPSTRSWSPGASYGSPNDLADTLAVMDEVGIGSAVLVGVCTSTWTTLLLAADHPWVEATAERLADELAALL